MTRLLIAALFLPLVAQAQFTPQEYGARREALAAKLPDGAIVVLGAREPAHDYLEFNQSPGMQYLTGIREPDAALVMVRQGDELSGTVFVSPRDPRVEVWSGARLGFDGAKRISGLPARDNGALLTVLDSLAGAGLPFFVIGASGGGDTLARSPDEQLVAALRVARPQLRVTPAHQQLDQVRSRKSAAELNLIRRAVEITVEAHREAMRTVRPDMYEYEIEGLVEYVFRRNGAERPSFATIIGSGPNSTTLHYNANDRRLQPGEIVVMDIGASYQGYAADVTRTVPTSGAFSPEQREVYQIVRAAQAAAEAEAKPGVAWQRVNDAATSAIAQGLARLGLIESPAATFDATPSGGTRPQHTLFYMHGLGHGIGLEVHDPEQFYYTRTVAEGSAFTIEPGIYVRADVLDHLPDTPRNRALVAKLRPVVERYRNVGVRIEDDYIVTEKGTEWISRAPREIAEIEALMRRRSIP